MLKASEILQRFIETKLQVHPDVVRYLQEQNDPALVDQVIAAASEKTVVVSAAVIPKLRAERDGTRFLTDHGLEVLAGAAGTSEAVTSVHDYVHYFRDRYNQLGAIVRARAHAMPIEALVKTTRYKQQECTIIGMVGDSRTSTKGHRIVQVEDPTGTIAVLFNKNRPDFSEAERLIPDEVIGVRGTLSPEGTLFFGNQLIRPDIPLTHAPFKSQTPGRAVMISDVHVGSDTFLPEAWDRFSTWLKTAGVSYLLIAGDVVDGIGVYPGQEQDLVIKNIYEQYQAFGEMLAELPDSLKIVVSPGNHDVVRGAEPQPAFPDKFTGSFPKNCTVVENPAQIGLQGVRVLMYHGRSIDDMISLIPGASYENPGQMMEEMLQRRHLASSYGRRTPIAASKQDRLVINPIPEILLTGHVHIMGITRYRGVLGINAGTWQGQTGFQKQMNINPTPARAVEVDLQTLEYTVHNFSEA